ncbi:MAG TPA: glycerol-3-phosphate dehydrogenase/oxidase [Gemmatimonadaceae bacterium]
MSTTSWLDRHHALDRLGRLRFDVLVVGGGITGAGIARDAALRGLRVALVDRGDFAGGTSSRSSRLVHGGVRYLEHGHVRLVFEASRERRLLLRVAPHLVRPLAFTWPLYRGGRIPRWKLLAGLTLYDALARFGNVGRHRRLSAAEVLRAEPALARDGLLGGARYWDAATDDARLTLATVLAAADADATVANHCAVRALTHGGGRVTGAVVADRFGAPDRPVRADVVVNATGAWTDELLALDDGAPHAQVRGTRGAHVLVPRERVRNAGAVTLLSPVDGRVMFVLPAGQFTLVGTTDTRTTVAPEEVRATEADVAYLLASTNALFPEAALVRDDVVSAWAGLRPLVAAGQAGDASEGRLSREHALTWSRSGMLTVTGGKLTTFRSMAAEAVDAVIAKLHRRAGQPLTQRRTYPGGDFLSLAGEEAAATTAIGDPEAAVRLVRAHGARWRRVWALTEQDRRLRERVDPELPYLAVEVVYAVRQELACTPGDVLLRRLPLAFETRDHGRAALDRVIDLMAPLLHWDAATRAAMRADYEAEIERILGVAAE